MTYTTEDQGQEMETLAAADDSGTPKMEVAMATDIANTANDAKSINLDMIDGRKLVAITAETKFYDTLFSIISPFVYLGMPYNYCFPNRYKACHRIHDSWVMKTYTMSILMITHILLGFWLVSSVVELATSPKLNDDLLLKIFRLSYILAGALSLDIIWYHRAHIKTLLSAELDSCPLDGVERYAQLHTKDDSYFRFYRYKTFFLKCLSRLLVLLLLAFVIYLVSAIVIAYTDSDPQGYNWSNINDLVSVFALYFFVSNAIFLVAIIWAIKYKILHLNLYVTNLTQLTTAPDINDMEIIKDWYRSIKKTASRVDLIFSMSGYLPIYIGTLTWGIIYFCSKLIDRLNSLKDMESVAFLEMSGLVVVLVALLFYSFKELTDVYEYSSATKSILYDYVLNTKPEVRSTVFFEEINFVATGLLSRPIKFTLFGHIELTKSFMAHMALAIYSYVVVFHQLSKRFITTNQADVPAAP